MKSQKPVGRSIKSYISLSINNSLFSDIELSYESLEKHLRVGTLNEAFLIGSISMVLGIIAGVLLLLFIAYIKSSMNHSSSPSLYGSPYGTSNYPTSMANENRGCSSAPGVSTNYQRKSISEMNIPQIGWKKFSKLSVIAFGTFPEEFCS